MRKFVILEATLALALVVAVPAGRPVWAPEDAPIEEAMVRDRPPPLAIIALAAGAMFLVLAAVTLV